MTSYLDAIAVNILDAESQHPAPPEPDMYVVHPREREDSPLAIARAVERILAEAVTLCASPSHAPHASGIVWDASATALQGAPAWATDEAMALLADTAVRLAGAAASIPMHLVLQETAWAARDEVRRLEQAEHDRDETGHTRRQTDGPALREFDVRGEAA